MIGAASPAALPAGSVGETSALVSRSPRSCPPSLSRALSYASIALSPRAITATTFPVKVSALWAYRVPHYLSPCSFIAWAALK